MMFMVYHLSGMVRDVVEGYYKVMHGED